MAISEQELKDSGLMNLHGGGYNDMVIGGINPDLFEQEARLAGSDETLQKIGDVALRLKLTQDSDH